MENVPELEFKGLGVSSGIAAGPARVLKPSDATVPDYAISDADVPRELIRLEQALIVTRRQLRDIQQRVGSALGSESARIFESHLHVVDDASFIEEIYHDLRTQKRNAEAVLHQASERYAKTLQNMEDDYLRERATDIRDVTRRVLRILMGQTTEPPIAPDSPRILVAADITPSDLAGLDRHKLLGIATEQGSSTAHTAIMARAMELPAVVGVRDLCARVSEGDRLLLDGVRGVVVVHPTPAREKEFARIARSRQSIRKRLDALKDEPATTLDGHAMTLVANIETPGDVSAVLARGARGIGLFRTEYLFLANAGEPDEEQQVRAYAEVARHDFPDGVVIRTLDLGGDKLSPTFHQQPEANPFLGWRAIRLCLDLPALFKTQLRAILRASANHPHLRIMFPMVSSVAEFEQANKLLEECKAELDAAGVPFHREVEVGVMVEIPSAALMAHRLARRVRFFSIGTNDLVQYTLAVDRGNDRVAHLFDPAHPAVLELIERTVAAGREQGISTSVCGEMAGNPVFVPLLMGLGVDTLSVSPSAIALIKAVIRHVTYADAVELAAEVRAMEGGEEVQSRCRELIRQCAPEILELAE